MPSNGIVALVLPSTPNPQINNLFICLLIFFCIVLSAIIILWGGYKVIRVLCSKFGPQSECTLKMLEEGTRGLLSTRIPARPLPTYQTKTEYKIKDTRRLSPPFWMTAEVPYGNEKHGPASPPIITRPSPIGLPPGLFVIKARTIPADKALANIGSIPAGVAPPAIVTPRMFALSKVADDVVGDHPNSAPLYTRSNSKTYVDMKTGSMIFPWAPNKGKKIGAVPTIVTRPPTPPKPARARKPLQDISMKKGSISYNVPRSTRRKSRRQPGGKENCPPQTNDSRPTRIDPTRLHPIYPDRF